MPRGSLPGEGHVKSLLRPSWPVRTDDLTKGLEEAKPEVR